MGCDHEFRILIEGLTPIGGHLHVYQCVKCAMLDHKFEMPEEVTLWEKKKQRLMEILKE